MSPYRQGSLDSLCSVYSIVNAIRLIFKDMTEEDSIRLFKRILKCIEKRKRLSSVMIDGIDDGDLRHILKSVVEPRYPVTWKTPFRNMPSVTVNAFWRGITEFLMEGQRTVILAMEYDEWDHWSSIQRVTDRQLWLFDSSAMKRINRSRCTTGKATSGRPCVFYPGETFFIGLKE